MQLINTRILSNWGNWFRIPLMAFVGLSAIAIVTGRLHNAEKETDNGE